MPALTAIRFPLALWVVLYHVAKPWLVDTDGALRNLVAGAPVAVPFFFVLSGFVLTVTYRDGLSVPRYLRARVARIVPLYLLSVLVVVPVGLIARARGVVTDDAPWLSLAAVTLGVQAWVPSLALRWNPALWSVSVEVFLYACFPLLLAITRAASGWRAGAGAFTCAVAAALPPLAYEVMQPDGPMPGALDDEGFWFFVVRFHPVLRVFELLAGMLAARAFLSGALVHVAVALGSVGVLGAVLATGVAPPVMLFGGGTALVSVVAVLALAGVTRGPLATPLAVRFGTTSYALYVLHLPVFFWMLGIAKRAPDDVTPGFGVIVVGVACAAAIAAHRLVEEPMRRAWNRTNKDAR